MAIRRVSELESEVLSLISSWENDARRVVSPQMSLVEREMVGLVAQVRLTCAAELAEVLRRNMRAGVGE